MSDWIEVTREKDGKKISLRKNNIQWLSQEKWGTLIGHYPHSVLEGETVRVTDNYKYLRICL